MDEKAQKFNFIHELYKKCKDISISDTFELFLQAEDDEERDFIRVVTDFMLQQRQKQVIAKTIF